MIEDKLKEDGWVEIPEEDTIKMLSKAGLTYDNDYKLYSREETVIKYVLLGLVENAKPVLFNKK